MKFTVFIILSLGIMACQIPKNTITSPIGVVSLNNYKLIDAVKLTEEISYKYFTKAEDFQRFFSMTKSTRETAIVPDFNTQSVVAIVMQPTMKIITLQIEKAAIGGDELSIYFSRIDTTTTFTAAYAQPVTTLAIVPKNEGIKTVSFYNSNLKVYALKIPD